MLSITSKKLLRISLIALTALPLAAVEDHGNVKFGGMPVPGATITATQGDKKIVTITDAQGNYAFPDLAPGVWTLQVDMLCFETDEAGCHHCARRCQRKLGAETAADGPDPRGGHDDCAPGSGRLRSDAPNLQVAAAPNAADNKKKARADPGRSRCASPAPNADPSQDASDNFLINGSQNNGAASPFAQSAAFGNNRRNLRGLYNGMFRIHPGQFRPGRPHLFAYRAGHGQGHLQSIPRRGDAGRAAANSAADAQWPFFHRLSMDP